MECWGRDRLQVLTRWSGEASLKRWNMSKDLNDTRKIAIRISGGRAVDTQRRASSTARNKRLARNL